MRWEDFYTEPNPDYGTSAPYNPEWDYLIPEEPVYQEPIYYPPEPEQMANPNWDAPVSTPIPDIPNPVQFDVGFGSPIQWGGEPAPINVGVGVFGNEPKQSAWDWINEQLAPTRESVNNWVDRMQRQRPEEPSGQPEQHGLYITPGYTTPTDYDMGESILSWLNRLHQDIYGTILIPREDTGLSLFNVPYTNYKVAAPLLNPKGLLGFESKPIQFMQRVQEIPQRALSIGLEAARGNVKNFEDVKDISKANEPIWSTLTHDWFRNQQVDAATDAINRWGVDPKSLTPTEQRRMFPMGVPESMERRPDDLLARHDEYLANVAAGADPVQLRAEYSDPLPQFLGEYFIDPGNIGPVKELYGMLNSVPLAELGAAKWAVGKGANLITHAKIPGVSKLVDLTNESKYNVELGQISDALDEVKIGKQSGADYLAELENIQRGNPDSVSRHSKDVVDSVREASGQLGTSLSDFVTKSLGKDISTVTPSEISLAIKRVAEANLGQKYNIGRNTGSLSELFENSKQLLKKMWLASPAGTARNVLDNGTKMEVAGYDPLLAVPEEAFDELMNKAGTVKPSGIVEGGMVASASKDIWNNVPWPIGRWTPIEDIRPKFNWGDKVVEPLLGIRGKTEQSARISTAMQAYVKGWAENGAAWRARVSEMYAPYLDSQQLAGLNTGLATCSSPESAERFLRTYFENPFISKVVPPSPPPGPSGQRFVATAMDNLQNAKTPEQANEILSNVQDSVRKAVDDAENGVAKLSLEQAQERERVIRANAKAQNRPLTPQENEAIVNAYFPRRPSENISVGGGAKEAVARMVKEDVTAPDMTPPPKPSSVSSGGERTVNSMRVTAKDAESGVVQKMTWKELPGDNPSARAWQEKWTPGWTNMPAGRAETVSAAEKFMGRKIIDVGNLSDKELAFTLSSIVGRTDVPDEVLIIGHGMGIGDNWKFVGGGYVKDAVEAAGGRAFLLTCDDLNKRNIAMVEGKLVDLNAAKAPSAVAPEVAKATELPDWYVLAKRGDIPKNLESTTKDIAGLDAALQDAGVSAANKAEMAGRLSPDDYQRWATAESLKPTMLKMGYDADELATMTPEQVIVNFGLKARQNLRGSSVMKVVTPEGNLEYQRVPFGRKQFEAERTARYQDELSRKVAPRVEATRLARMTEEQGLVSHVLDADGRMYPKWVKDVEESLDPGQKLGEFVDASDIKSTMFHIGVHPNNMDAAQAEIFGKKMSVAEIDALKDTPQWQKYKEWATSKVVSKELQKAGVKTGAIRKMSDQDRIAAYRKLYASGEIPEEIAKTPEIIPEAAKVEQQAAEFAQEYKEPKTLQEWLAQKGLDLEKSSEDELFAARKELVDDYQYKLASTPPSSEARTEWARYQADPRRGGKNKVLWERNRDLRNAQRRSAYAEAVSGMKEDVLEAERAYDRLVEFDTQLAKRLPSSNESYYTLLDEQDALNETLREAIDSGIPEEDPALDGIRRGIEEIDIELHRRAPTSGLTDIDIAELIAQKATAEGVAELSWSQLRKFLEQKGLDAKETASRLADAGLLKHTAGKWGADYDAISTLKRFVQDDAGLIDDQKWLVDITSEWRRKAQELIDYFEDWKTSIQNKWAQPERVSTLGNLTKAQLSDLRRAAVNDMAETIHTTALDARSKVGELLFDYQHGIRGFEEVLSFVFPFPKYPIRNPGLWAELILKNPRVAKFYNQYYQATANPKPPLTNRFSGDLTFDAGDTTIGVNPLSAISFSPYTLEPYTDESEEQLTGPQKDINEVIKITQAAGLSPWSPLRLAGQVLGLYGEAPFGNVLPTTPFAELATSQLPKGPVRTAAEWATGVGEEDVLQRIANWRPLGKDENRRDLFEAMAKRPESDIEAYYTRLQLDMMVQNGEISPEQALIAKAEKNGLYWQAREEYDKRNNWMRIGTWLQPFGLDVMTGPEKELRTEKSLLSKDASPAQKAAFYEAHPGVESNLSTSYPPDEDWKARLIHDEIWDAYYANPQSKLNADPSFAAFLDKPEEGTKRWELFPAATMFGWLSKIAPERAKQLQQWGLTIEPVDYTKVKAAEDKSTPYPTPTPDTRISGMIPPTKVWPTPTPTAFYDRVLPGEGKNEFWDEYWQISDKRERGELIEAYPILGFLVDKATSGLATPEQWQLGLQILREKTGYVPPGITPDWASILLGSMPTLTPKPTGTPTLSRTPLPTRTPTDTKTVTPTRTRAPTKTPTPKKR